MERWQELCLQLRPKQRRFVEEYVKSENATEAVKLAGYKAKNDNVAAVIGTENINKPKVRAAIQAYIAARQAETAQVINYTRADAIREYDAAIEIAKQKGQAGSMCTAIAGKASLLGLDVAPATNPADAKPLTREELEQALAELDELEGRARKVQDEVNLRIRKTG